MQPLNKQTMKRMHQFHAGFMVLFVFVHGPAASETERMENKLLTRKAVPVSVNGQPRYSRTVQTGKPAAPTKKNGRIGQDARQSSSEFVRLAQMIANNTFVFNTFNDFGTNAFDPDIVDRILVTRKTRWAFGRIDTGSVLNLPSTETGSSRSTAGIRPLKFDLNAFNPFFGNFFRPRLRGRFIPAAEDLTPFSGITASNPTSFFATGLPHQGLEDSRTDFTVGTAHAPLAYSYAMDKTTSVKAGIAWIHDLSDTTGMSRALEDPGADDAGGNKLSGVNLNVGARYKAVTLTGGYIHPLDSSLAAELTLAGKESDPMAWNSELAYCTELLRRETTLAVGYQRSSEALQYYLPEERYSTRASMNLSNSTTFSLEYYQDKADATKNGEESGYGITTRIGYDF